MRAGALKYKVTILEPQRLTDKFGAEATNFVTRATVWAERVKANGNRSEEVGEHFPAFNTQYNIRAAHNIGENWRVQELGGYLYNVVAIIPNLDRGYKTLICERVNE